MLTQTRSPARTALLTAALAMLALLGVVLLMMELLAKYESEQCTLGNPAPVGGVPAQLAPIYQAAASKYSLGPLGPAVLGAINEVESSFGQNLSTSTAGAVGWMQFEPGTWASYGVTPTGAKAPDGPQGWNDPQDAIYSAANYLRASGAPGDWSAAIYAYNHAGWYVSEVTSLAQRYLAAAGGQGARGGSGSGGGGARVSSTVALSDLTQTGCSVQTAITSGPRATIGPDGTAAVPAGAPVQVQAAIAAGNLIIHSFYSQERRANMLSQVQDSYDCSGSVDWVLSNAGLSSPLVDVGSGVAGDSSLLEQYGQNGPGQWITVFGSTNHAFIEVAGILLDTSYQGAAVTPSTVPDSYPPGDPQNGGPHSGPRWVPLSILQSQLHDGNAWTARHPPGL